MLIAQLSDLHAMPPGRTLDGLDTNQMLDRAVARVAAMTPRPDVVLLTGDLTEGGTAQAYQVVRDAIETLGIPFFPVVGNHDERDAFRVAFGDLAFVPASGFIQYAVDYADLRLLALDTLDEGRGGGCLCPERLRWLEDTLAARPHVPTLIFMHHPPFDTGIDWMDAEFRGQAELERVVKHHPQVTRVLCGHLHRPITGSLAHAAVTVAPSTCFQVHLDLAPRADPSIIMEPAGYHLHAWNGRAFVTHQGIICDDTHPITLCNSSHAA